MILSNQRYCERCDEDIYSAHRHDYVVCSCGDVMVDGGMDYLKSSGSGINKSISITDEEYTLLMEAITDPTRNDLGHVCNLVRVLRDTFGVNLTNYSGVTDDT